MLLRKALRSRRGDFKTLTMFQPSDVDNLTDAEIKDLFLNIPQADDLYPSNVRRITEKIIVKGAFEQEQDPKDYSEALALEYVFLKSDIPVPRVHRVVGPLIAMDFIPGKTLSEVWSCLSFIGKLHVAMTLRRYIRKLKAIDLPGHTIPGPLFTEKPHQTLSPLFGLIRNRHGPFNSCKEFSSFFNDKAEMGLRQKLFTRPGGMGRFDDSAPLVFTHQDLNMRNVIVGDDGRLWLIDWGWAGWYPPWFEYVAMKRQAENEEGVTGGNLKSRFGML